MTERLCKDCVHLRRTPPDSIGVGFWFCTSDKRGINPVTGKRKIMRADFARDDQTDCSWDGQWFEPIAAAAANDNTPPPADKPHQQTRLGSLIEALTGTAVGFIISVLVSHWLYPLYGFHPTVAMNVEITAIFTAVSILRGYVLRRVFTRIKRLHQ